MNLREEKGWSYGAFSLLWDARGQRPFIVYAPVQTDKTKESMEEIVAELKGIVGTEPVTSEELEFAQKQQTLSLPGQWETNGAVMASIAEMVRFDLPDNHFDTYAEQVQSLDVGAVSKAAQDVVMPDNLVWVVVGDRAKIEGGLRELGFGEIQYLDADGNLIGGGTQ
jgi:zinc protease